MAPAIVVIVVCFVVAAVIIKAILGTAILQELGDCVTGTEIVESYPQGRGTIICQIVNVGAVFNQVLDDVVMPGTNGLMDLFCNNHRAMSRSISRTPKL
jgi:hypothetical protein